MKDVLKAYEAGLALDQESKVATASRRAYWAHLRAIGVIDETSDLVYFATEVFHDSRLRVVRCDPAAGTVRVRLDNVYAIDVCSGRGVRVKRALFATEVLFRGVSRIELVNPSPPVGAIYVWSVIGKRDGHWVIKLLMDPIWGVPAGHLLVECESVCVENISQKLRDVWPGAPWSKRVIPPLSKCFQF